MEIGCWLDSWGDTPQEDIDAFADGLIRHGIAPTPFNQDDPAGPGVCIFTNITPDLGKFLRSASRRGHERVIAITHPEGLANRRSGWELLREGASDVLVWSDLDDVARQVKARFERWGSVEHLLNRSDV